MVFAFTTGVAPHVSGLWKSADIGGILNSRAIEKSGVGEATATGRGFLGRPLDRCRIRCGTPAHLAVGRDPGKDLMPKILLAIAMTLLQLSYASIASAKDMSFSLQQKDLRPNFDFYQWIFADGEIVPGTTQKFQSFVRANPSLIGGATVILNSPGGSVEEGIRLGDAIRDLRFRTDVGAAATDPMSRIPGQCLSACIFPYLGGEYRYLSNGSIIGIHRFRFSDPTLSGSVATEVSQLLAGDIVTFFNKSRVDSRLFPLMTKTAPDDIQIISEQELRAMKLVTDDIYSEAWSFEIVEGQPYLKGDQVSRRGENKLIFVCERNNSHLVPVLFAMSELPDHNSILRSAQGIILFLDDTTLNLQPSLVNEQPRPTGGLWLSWAITFTPDLVKSISQATKIGSGISVGGGIFAGFSGINVGTGKDKLLEILDQCRSTGKLFHGNEQSVPNSTPRDVALATRLAHNLDREYRKGGMTRLRSSVDECYQQAKSNPTDTTIQYCYILDQISCSLDEEFFKQFHKPQLDDFWKKESGVSRTLAIMNSINSDTAANYRTLQTWENTKDIAINVMLSLIH